MLIELLLGAGNTALATKAPEFLGVTMRRPHQSRGILAIQ
jgi:hypothetical protein